MNQSDQSHPSEPSDQSPTHHLLPAHGGYRRLRSFQAALMVFDATVIFCDRFIEKRSRTHDQMVQAARSGVQNIAEGSMASGTSKKTELKLTNVARASLEELLRDYEDFLRQRALRLWEKNSPEALAARDRFRSDRSDSSVRSDPSDMSFFHTASPEAAANTCLCLINQASFLLHRQLQRLEQDFLRQGGFTERLYAVRTQARSQAQTQPSPPSPACPACGNAMRLRTARQGPHAGQPFWGCSAYPQCRGTRPA